MSGTSLDGIDIALCEIDATNCRLLASAEYPFDAELKSEILAMIHGNTTLKEVGLVNAKLGALYAKALQEFFTQHKLNAKEIKAIGLHGQTLWHEPLGEFAFSMQLGDANRVAASLGVSVISDFRGMDIANGGEGAPFAPAFHHFLWHHLKGNVGVLNIGGMANITLLKQELRGWDTGCGNVLLDLWIQKTTGQAYDEEGAFARSGEVHQGLLKTMLDETYFDKLPPKSTGRELFNASWLEDKLEKFDTIKNKDVQRTLLELTAISIASDIKKEHLERLIVCGGGAKNSFLMQRLNELCSCEVQSSDTLGIESDSLEAMAFAWLAYKRIHKEKVALKSVTGARKNSILGAVYEGY